MEKSEQRRAELIGKSLAAAKGSGNPLLDAFLPAFLAGCPAAELESDAPGLTEAARVLLAGAAQRPPGQPLIRLIEGGAGGRAALVLVNDDMPFLVASVSAAIQEAGGDIRLVVHPVVKVDRDTAGNLRAIGQGAAESWMYFALAPLRGPILRAAIPGRVTEVLADVRAAVSDWGAMREAMARSALAVDTAPAQIGREDREEAKTFISWLAEGHFTLLGTRRYLFPEGGAASILPDGRGLLTDPSRRLFGEGADAAQPEDIRQFLTGPEPLVIVKSSRRSTVHRATQLDIIGVKRFDADGATTELFVAAGLFTADVYTGSATAIPYLHRKVGKLMARAGFDPSGHSGRSLLNILETLPRDELFQVPEDALFELSRGLLDIQGQNRVALFLRKDEFKRFISCLVYVPRERYDTALRIKIQELLERACQARIHSYHTLVTDSPQARLHITLGAGEQGVRSKIDLKALEAEIAAATRSWTDRLGEALVEMSGEAVGAALLARWGQAFPAVYRERVSPEAAVEDLHRLEMIAAGRKIDIRLHKGEDGGEDGGEEGGGLRFKILHQGSMLALSSVLPTLENLGVRVLDEASCRLLGPGGREIWMHDFGLDAPLDPERDGRRFEEAFLAVREESADDDSFNRLVTAAGLEVRAVAMMRALARWLRQTGFAAGLAAMARTLAARPETTKCLWALFEARFNPALKGSGEQVAAELAVRLDAIENAEEDRILRRFALLIDAVLRTNFYQSGAKGQDKPYLAFKIDSQRVPDLPAPRPMAEIWVHSPRVEGVHLRGGRVARGGIRWSDRPEDFRTEILGLIKAQMVKNAVIVPVGAKGGFVVRKPPAEGGRDAFLAEGIACYKMLIDGLLDLTDNIVQDQIVPPQGVLRQDGDDPYLVVAADKGTATFSDIANGLSQGRGFWLGDAFASGGSKGYDHKGMGITARGAWVAVRRHFAEMGLDPEQDVIRVAGVGDMSGDVFGNGLLRSRTVKLVGAFDHRHIFLDPDPDPAQAFAERQRLFALPRSSWADYDAKLISKGGGVWPRTAKTIPLSPEIRAILGLAQEQADPAAVIRALLTSPVDLLWFGGIGTYIKARSQSHADAGDKASDAVRVDAEDLRCKVVGEGANLAMTQAARIAYALKGGRINTDAIDNSAGVDTSDHEVNLKIPLNAEVTGKRLDGDERDALLVSMTDDIAQLVLADNTRQTLALSLALRQGVDLLDPAMRFMRLLERQGKLDRRLEGLPDDETLGKRQAEGKGLMRPELAVLLAYAKIWLKGELLASDLPSHPLLAGDLAACFPASFTARFKEALARHPLKREIITKHLVNHVVDRLGITFVSALMERSESTATSVMQAFLAIRESYGLEALWNSFSADMPLAANYALHEETARLTGRAVQALLADMGEIDPGRVAALLTPGVEVLTRSLAELADEETLGRFDERTNSLAQLGAPGGIAANVARLAALAAAPDIVELAGGKAGQVPQAAALYFAVGARFGLGRLRRAADRLKGSTSWQKRAAEALVEEFHALQRDLAKAVSRSGSLDAWALEKQQAVERADRLLMELKGEGEAIEAAALTVAARRLKSLLV